MDLSINTRNGKVAIDGKPLDTVTDISFKWSAGKLPEITMTFDMQVLFGGEISTGAAAKIKCPHCGFLIGKIAGHFNSLHCGHCGKIINSSMVEFAEFDFSELVAPSIATEGADKD